MADFSIEQQPVLLDQPITGAYLKNTKDIQIGSGSEQFSAGPEGIFLGADNFDDATFSVDMQGNLNAEGGTFGGNITSSSTITGATINTDEIYDSTYGYSGVFVKTIKTSGSGSNAYITIGTNSGGLLNVQVNYTTNSDTQYKLLPSFNVSNNNSYWHIAKVSGNYSIYLEKSDIASDISGINYFYITALFNSNEINGW